jgi:hypothetical protein
MKTLITRSVWKGIELIDIRKYFTKGDELLPSRKGISLTPKQFESLLSEFSDKYGGSAESFQNNLPFEIEEKFMISTKVDVEFKNGVIKAYLDPEIAQSKLETNAESIIVGIQELCAEHDLDPKLSVQKIFKYL